MIRPSAALLGLLLTASPALAQSPALAAGPSFDCGKAATIDERLICASPDLSAADLELARTVKAAGRPDLAARQRRWVAVRNAACGLKRWMDESAFDRAAATACLLRAYDARTAQIAGMAAGPAPFTPHLTLGQDIPLCRAFAAAQQDAFRSTAAVVSVIDRPWPGVTVDWLVSPGREEHGDAPAGGRTAIFPADLTGDGPKQALVLFSRYHSWRGNMHSLLRFPSYQAALDWQRRGNPDTLAPDNAAMVRNSGQNDSFGWDWHIPAVARVDGRAYLVDEGSVWEDLAPARLFRIPASGGPEPVCEVQRQPTAPSKEARANEPVADLHETVARMAAGDGSCGGTLHADVRVAQAAEQVLSKALLRPWAVADNAAYNQPATVETWLAAWAALGARNHDRYDDYLRQRPAALGALTELYAKGFGFPDPEAEARRVIDLVVAAHFVFPASGKPGETLPRATPLAAALLAGRPVADLAPLIGRTTANAPALRPVAGDTDDTAAEPPLFFALRQPDAVRLLLAAGADANRANAFGKTPLMLAAHQDQPDSARLLLAAGARPADRTRPLHDCRQQSFDIVVGDRTALHYAAENAGLEMIRLLVTAGADIAAKTSEGDTPLDMLRRNTRLSADDRDRAARLLRGDR